MDSATQLTLVSGPAANQAGVAYNSYVRYEGLGLLVGARGVTGTYASTLGIFGREMYNLDAAEAAGFKAGDLIAVSGRLRSSRRS